MRILLVCTGNICRSPSAEGVLRARVGTRGLAERVTIDSCGTHGYHAGEPPDLRAVRVCRGRGIDIAGLRARAWQASDAGHDLIVGMEGHHQRWVGKRLPTGSNPRVVRLMDFAADPTVRDVPDPYYGTFGEFEHMLDLIELGVDGLVARLEAELADSS